MKTYVVTPHENHLAEMVIMLGHNIRLKGVIYGKNYLFYPFLSGALAFMTKIFQKARGRSGGAMMLGKLPVPGRPTNLDYSRATAYCACSRCGWGCLDIFSLIYLFSFLSSSLWETARYRLKYYLKGPLSPKQPTNQLSKRQMT